MLCYLIDIIDLGYSDDGKPSQVAVEEHWLRICVADDANASVAFKLWQL